MKATIKKLLSHLMFLLLVALIFHFLFNYVKIPDNTVIAVFKQFSTIYITGLSSLMIYFIWGNTLQNL